jgi:phosphoribosylformimino-5-aminoimidazole carboxamide ribonucleotide (ProFAR) isomerase
VDLDAARDEASPNGPAIRRIVDGVGDRVGIEVAGGLRNRERVAAAFEVGVTRVVMGTAAIDDPPFVGRLVADYGVDRVVVALDVRDGLAVGHGWRKSAPGVHVTEALAVLADQGVQTFEVTSIERDGLLEGPDLALLRELVALGRGRMVASAGISSVDDLRAVRSLGCAGAIVGRALYEDRISLPEAIAALASG